MVKEIEHFNRRRFLQVAAATTSAVACNLARFSNANAAESHSLIDTHVYVGHWPLGQLPATSPVELAALLRLGNVTQAWAGSFDGLFHKDIHGANLRLVDACRDVGDGMLIPIGSVNLTLPDWEEDVRRCHETFKMHGIRLHPTYHGYKLDDPRFARLLDLAAARSLFVQLVVQVTEVQQRILTPRVPQVDLAPLARIVDRIHGLRLLVANGVRVAKNVANSGVVNMSNVCFDYSRIINGDELHELVGLVSADRVVNGSVAPLFDVAASTKLLQQANLKADEMDAISNRNARELMSATGRRRSR